MLVGYIRVSTWIQLSGYSIEIQEKQLKDHGCERVFSDCCSGAKAERKGLNEMLAFIRNEQDTVVVCRLDRLGRNLRDLIAIIEDFKKRNIGFVSLAESMDTRTAQGLFLFHMFGALAEFERELIKERTHNGIKLARSRGKPPGRKRKITDTQLLTLQKLHADKRIPIDEICKTFNMERSTMYKYLQKIRQIDAEIFSENEKAEKSKQ